MQITYIEARVKDIQELSDGTEFEGIMYQDRIRIFSGDNPARQFESGHKRGGNYSCPCGVASKNHINLECCFQRKSLSLEERRTIVMEGNAYDKLVQGQINPFQKLTKSELEDELEARGVNTTRMSKIEMQEELDEILEGICRPPALMLLDPKKTATDLEIEDYEVLKCEPLHDICNVVQNLLTELPHHIDNTASKKQIEEFCVKAIGDKNQLKGSDARTFIIKLAKFLEEENENGNLCEDGDDVEFMIKSLVEIINIAYSAEEHRNPRMVLRLFNLTFMFGLLARKIIAIPAKLTQRKFYGNHFHSIVCHLPEVYRVVNTKTVLTEDEERSFGALRSISEKTTNRKAEHIIDNAIIRFRAQENADDRSDSFRKQDSTISKLGRMLQKLPKTVLTKELLEDKPYLCQLHMARISKFLEAGEGVWWHRADSNIVFHDGHDDLSFRDQGPKLAHLRSASIKSEIESSKLVWQNCVEKFQTNELTLPLSKIKTRNENGKVVYVYPGKNIDVSDETVEEMDTPLDMPEEITEKEDTVQEMETCSNMPQNLIVEGHEEDSVKEIETCENNPEDLIEEDKTVQEMITCSNMQEDLIEKAEAPPHLDVFTKLLVPTETCNLEMNKLDKIKEINNGVKLMYKNYIRDIQVCHTRPKRRLFEKQVIQVEAHEESDSDPICPFDDSTDEESEEELTEIKPIETISASVLVENLLGDTSDVKCFQKYRRLAFHNPLDRSFMENYETAKARVGFQVLGVYSKIKKRSDASNSMVVRQTKQLLDHWKIRTD